MSLKTIICIGMYFDRESLKNPNILCDVSTILSYDLIRNYFLMFDVCIRYTLFSAM